jgi:hypothetical protein
MREPTRLKDDPARHAQSPTKGAASAVADPTAIPSLREALALSCTPAVGFCISWFNCPYVPSPEVPGRLVHRRFVVLNIGRTARAIGLWSYAYVLPIGQVATVELEVFVLNCFTKRNTEIKLLVIVGYIRRDARPIGTLVGDELPDV